MSNIHTIGGSSTQFFVNVVAHFTVTGNNVLGVPFSTAGTIAPDEAEKIALGQTFEFSFRCPLPENWDSLNAAQQQAVIDAAYATQVTAIQVDATAKLNYFGASLT